MIRIRILDIVRIRIWLFDIVRLWIRFLDIVRIRIRLLNTVRIRIRLLYTVRIHDTGGSICHGSAIESDNGSKIMGLRADIIGLILCNLYNIVLKSGLKYASPEE